jgi:archaellum component FlaF (FlaF/FlaG flagellin family)
MARQTDGNPITMLAKPRAFIFLILLAVPPLLLAFTSVAYSPGLTSRVSVASDGTQGNANSYWAIISGNGRYIAFYSEASDLVTGDTNTASDIFVRDLQASLTTRISVASGGGEADGNSFMPAISSDGRFVSFDSEATNLVGGDTNHMRDVFVHDRQSGQTTRVSVASNGAQANGDSSSPAISTDGRYVGFDSQASNLVIGDTNGKSDAFIRDRQTGQTTRISVSSSGVQGNDDSYTPVISADGRYVVFGSWASNLVPGDTNGCSDIFVRDRQLGQTRRVSVASGGVQANDVSGYPTLSADGRYVAFRSWATNLVPGDTNDSSDIFVYDRQTGEISRVSVSSGGDQTNRDAYSPAISADGRYVVFDSPAANLVPGDTNHSNDVFVHDRQTGETFLVSLASNGSLANDNSAEATVSADGGYVAFESWANNLVPGDSNDVGDVFVHERQFSVSGRVIDREGNGLAGVTVDDGAGHTFTTGDDGSYSLGGLARGTHTFTATYEGYTFLPHSRTVAVPPDAVDQNFIYVPEDQVKRIYLPLTLRETP